MTTPREPDPIVMAWLEEGPTELPEATRRAIAVATRTSEQKRRSPWASWRAPLMTPFARVAVAAIAVVALAGGTAYLLGTTASVGGPSPALAPSPSSTPPSPAPQGAVPVDWTTYTSSRFAYSIDYPTDWTVTPASADWLVGLSHPSRKNVDRFALTPTGTRVFVSSTLITDGMTSADRVAELDSVNAACELSDRHTVALGGATARQEDFFCLGVGYGIEVVAATDSRHFQIDLFSETPIGETDRLTFERFLASFRFDGSSEFTSTRYGYSLAYPSNLRVQPSQREWPAESVIEDTSPYLDRFTGHADRFGTEPVFAGLAAQPLPEGMAADDWMNGHAERNQRAFGDTCGGLPEDWEEAQVDGADGRRVLLDCGAGPGSVSEIVFTSAGRGWVISGDTALVDELLLTFRLPD